MKTTFLFLMIMIFAVVFSQEKINKKGNDYYISKHFEDKIALAEDAKLKSGFVYVGGDSIAVQLVKFKGRNKQNNFLFCLGKLESDSIVFYQANEIYGYSIEDEFYLSHFSNESYFFVRQRQKGRVDLYERVAIPSSPDFAYYFKFKEKEELLVFYPDKALFTVTELPTGSTGTSGGVYTVSNFSTTGVQEKFQLFIETYFGDCPKIPNMIYSGFHTINDISSIVNAYNNCE